MPATGTKQKTVPVDCGLRPELNGKLFQQPGTPAIYLVDQGWRRYLADTTIENTFKLNPEVEAFPVDEILLGSNIAPNACLIKTQDNPAIYLVDHNPATCDWRLFKRHLVSLYVYELYQFGSKVFIVPEVVINAIPTGDPIVGPPVMKR